MKTLRITATLLLTLIAGTACTAGSPTGPSLDSTQAAAHLDGGGFFGGGTNSLP